MRELEAQQIITIKRLSENLMLNKSEDVQNILDKASNVISDIVFYGAYIIDEIRENDPYVNDHKKRIILLILRDMLENIDSISVLMKNGCTNGIIPIQRTVVELYLSILFIFKDNFEEKIIAYDVCHINERILAGKNILERGGIDNIQEKEINEKIKILKDILSKNEYKTINKKWINYTKKEHHAPNWYEIISDKCTSIRKMAKKIDKLKVYDVIYSYYSKDTHGCLALLDYVCLDEEVFKIKSFRCPSVVSLLCKQNLIIANAVYEKVIENHLPQLLEIEYENWYLEKHIKIKELEILENKLNNK